MHRAIFRRGSLVELFAGKCPRKKASNQESPGEVVPVLHPPPGKRRSGKTRQGEKVRVELGGGLACYIEHSSKLSELFVLNYFYLYSANQLDCNFEPLFEGNASALVS